jgi:hypothetical protein
MSKTQSANRQDTKLRCPVCSQRLETTTTVRDAAGAARTLSALPGELTECEQCGSVFEYGGRPGELKVTRARPERVIAFRELARDKADHTSFQKMVAYVAKYRMTPRASELARFRYSCRN